MRNIYQIVKYRFVNTAIFLRGQIIKELIHAFQVSGIEEDLKLSFCMRFGPSFLNPGGPQH